MYSVSVKCEGSEVLAGSRLRRLVFCFASKNAREDASCYVMLAAFELELGNWIFGSAPLYVGISTKTL